MKETDTENPILKRIRYYQGSIQDFEDYWVSRINDSKEDMEIRKKNDDLNKSCKITPVEEYE